MILECSKEKILLLPKEEDIGDHSIENVEKIGFLGSKSDFFGKKIKFLGQESDFLGRNRIFDCFFFRHNHVFLKIYI
jgi:hypothetical protein